MTGFIERRFEHPSDILTYVENSWVASGQPLIRIDGLTGVGKSTLAEGLERRLSATAIHGDCFIPTEGGSVDVVRLRHAATVALGSTLVIFDTIRVGEYLPEVQFGRGFKVYVKKLRVAGVGENRIYVWQDGQELDNPDAQDKYGVLAYHRKFKPQFHSDLVVAMAFEDLPEEEWRALRRPVF